MPTAGISELQLIKVMRLELVTKICTAKIESVLGAGLCDDFTKGKE